jgi:2-(1,2-epoxy-1,2-dihydrophenyl)acetyl-CoA isomerase
MTHSSPGNPNANVVLSLEGSVAHILLNRPEASNAVNLETATTLGEVVDQVAADASIASVVITGSGARFCAGGDVASMLAATDRGSYVEELARSLDGVVQRIASLDKPVVGGVRGAVAGAGLALMLSCDLVVAGIGTRFVTAYSGVGLTPDCGLSWMLPRAIGQQRALELLLTNRAVDADEAQAWGLVTETTSDEGVADRALSLAATLADGPSSALGHARRLVRGSWEASRAEIGALEAQTIGRAVVTEEATRLLDGFTRR